MKIAIYPGSFDPITNGHLDIIRRATTLFDKLLIAVARNSEKNSLFTVAERMQLIGQVITWPNVEIVTFDGLLVDFAHATKASAIVRGLRAVTDFEYEFQMALMNHRLQPNVETVFLTAREDYTYLSSKLIKEVASLGGNITSFVPEPVEMALRQRLTKS
jgi:pantetheine-phosphate adenylyltransferase